MQIDLSEMKIHFRGQGPKEVLPILSASKELSAVAEAAIEQARLSSAESSSVQADQGITNSMGMKLVPIAKGKFQMGSGVQEEGYRFKEPRHEVTLTRDYYLGAFEVTQAQYAKLMGNNPSYFQGDLVDSVDSSNHPIDRVSWEDAVEFCKRLSELPEEKAAGRVYRLPTEAEWEYACRSGSNAPFGFGGLELSDDYGWFSSNSKGKSHPVGKKDMNAWGLHDLHGNVMEWCSDWAGDYPEGAVSDPTGPKEGNDPWRSLVDGRRDEQVWEPGLSFPSGHSLRLRRLPRGPQFPRNAQGVRTVARPFKRSRAELIRWRHL